MSEKDQPVPQMVIKLESEDYDPDDSEWQEECRKFYVQLRNSMDEVTVEPLKVKREGEGHRSMELIEVFSMLVAGISSLDGLSVLLNWTVPWLQRRKGCEITLKFPDGSEIKVSDASKEQILSLYETHLAKQGKQ